MMEPSFERLLARLAVANVRFVLVGGLAVALNGYVRLTEDVDILLEPSEPNVRRLLECLAAGHRPAIAGGKTVPPFVGIARPRR